MLLAMLLEARIPSSKWLRTQQGPYGTNPEITERRQAVPSFTDR